MTNPYQSIFDKLRAKAPELADTTPQQRIEKLRRLYKAVYELRHEISRAGHDELGMDGKLHLIPLKNEVDFICAHLPKWMARETVTDVPALQGRKAYIHYEPKGVILHIATWNSPVLIALCPALSMMAAGNAVVIKPSEITPQSAELVIKIIQKAKLEDEIAVITGDAHVAQNLLKLPFDHICYVGNNRVGKFIMQAAAEHFAGVTLEMGGKNPAIIAADADIEDTASKLAFARMIIAGQVCLSPDYLLIEKPVYEPFVDSLKDKLTAFFDPDGKGAQQSSAFARIVNKSHTRRIQSLIEDAIAKGAKIIYGGEVDVDKHYIAPTLIEGVCDDMDIAFEEIFGPVMLLGGYAGREQIIAEIGKRPKPLAAYIFTTSRETADWYIHHSRAGTSALNNAVTQANIPTLPFGGIGHSGIGRLGGEAGFKEFSNGRSIVEDALDPAQGPPMSYPPFPAEMAMFIDMMLQP